MLPTLWPIGIKGMKMHHSSCMGVETWLRAWRTPTKDQEEQDRSLYMPLVVSILAKKVIMP
jgi:hypothetical protein